MISLTFPKIYLSDQSINLMPPGVVIPLYLNLKNAFYYLDINNIHLWRQKRRTLMQFNPCYLIKTHFDYGQARPNEFWNEIGSGSGFQNLSRSALNIKVSNPSQLELFLQYLSTKVIIQYKNINYSHFMSKEKSEISISLGKN